MWNRGNKSTLAEQAKPGSPSLEYMLNRLAATGESRLSPQARKITEANANALGMMSVLVLAIHANQWLMETGDAKKRALINNRLLERAKEKIAANLKPGKEFRGYAIYIIAGHFEHTFMDPSYEAAKVFRDIVDLDTANVISKSYKKGIVAIVPFSVFGPNPLISSVVPVFKGTSKDRSEYKFFRLLRENWGDMIKTLKMYSHVVEHSKGYYSMPANLGKIRDSLKANKRVEHKYPTIGAY